MLANGQSMSAHERDHGVSLACLSYWKKALERKAGSPSAAQRDKLAFSEVVVVPRARTAAPRNEVVTRGGSAVRLESGCVSSVDPSRRQPRRARFSMRAKVRRSARGRDNDRRR